MNRKDVERLIIVADFIPVDHFYVTIDMLQRFAELVEAAEREACAKVCDDWAVKESDTRLLADAIRKRGVK